MRSCRRFTRSGSNGSVKPCRKGLGRARAVSPPGPGHIARLVAGTSRYCRRARPAASRHMGRSGTANRRGSRRPPTGGAALARSKRPATGFGHARGARRGALPVELGDPQRRETRRARPCAGARLGPADPVTLPMSDIATSSFETAGTSGLKTDSGWNASTSRWGFCGQLELAAPRQSSPSRNVTGAIAPTPAGSPSGATPAAATVSLGWTDLTPA